MKGPASLLALLLLQPAPCDHGNRGTSAPVRLDLVGAARREAGRRFSAAVGKVLAGDPMGAPFESGIPACRGGGRRTIRVDALPSALVGRRITFGPEGRGDVWVATRAHRLRDAAGAVLASPELAARLGVRCAPSRVTVRSETEVEIVEE